MPEITSPDDVPSALPGYIASAVRNLAAMGAGYLVGKGIIDSSMTAELGTLAVAVATIAWGWLKHHNDHKLIKKLVGGQ